MSLFLANLPHMLRYHLKTTFREAVSEFRGALTFLRMLASELFERARLGRQPHSAALEGDRHA